MNEILKSSDYRKVQGNSLVIATHNAGKVPEIRALLEVCGITNIKSGFDYDFEEPVEDGNTFIANAEIKARYFMEKTGELSLADDGGLCVELLNGEPGIYSARWAKQPDGSRDFNDAILKIKKAIEDKGEPIEGAKAHFTCALSLCFPDGFTQTFEGYCHGKLTYPKRGEHGFAYDPIFIPEGYNQTFGELPKEIKNKISHRSEAFAKLVKHSF